jgi:hypothetical protein
MDIVRRRFTLTTRDGETPAMGTSRVRSEYVEEAWLPFLGPNALLFARRADLALSTQSSCGVEVGRWATSLGMQPEELMLAANRLARYGLAEWAGDSFVLSRHWPPVPAAITTEPHRAALIALEDAV